MPPIQAICFDLFNTLVSVGEVPPSVGRYTADILGLDAEIWNDACFGPAHEICEPTEHEEIIRVLAHSIDPAIPFQTITQATRERQARFDFALSNIRSTTLDTLMALRDAGLKLALISNASTGEVSAWPDSPLAGLFDIAVFSCECGYKKPQADIYRLALDGLAVSTPAACLYVGDGGSQEFHGANALGMHTILSREFLKPQRYRRILAEQATSIGREIQTLGELHEIVQVLSTREVGTGEAGPCADIS